MPNVFGMGAKDAVFILERAGFKVFIRGKGRVSGQSVKAGTSIIKGSKIIIKLS